MTDIGDARILIMATNGFEQSELTEPLNRLREKGATVDVASQKTGKIRGWNMSDWGESVDVDLEITEASADDYDAIVLPGGQINPDLLRVDPDALDLLRSFLDKGRIVAAICHAPWLLVEVGALKGRKATSYKSIRKDVINAGADWIDEEVVSDNGIITSRNPDDLPAFIAKIVAELKEGKQYSRAA